MNCKIKKTAILFVVLIINFSCSKDDDPEVRDFETISFDREAVLAKLPDGLINSEDLYAQQAVEYVESSLNWSEFSDHFNPPGDALKTVRGNGETYSWSWAYDGTHVLTLWWTYSDGEEKNYWDIDIQYGEGDRADYINAWENKDGNEGEVVYNCTWTCTIDGSCSECGKLYWKYNWNRDANDNYSFYYSIEAEKDDFQSSMYYEVFINQDGSGSADYFFYGEHFYHLEWDAEGNGSWIHYFLGNEITGSWEAESDS